MYKLAALCDGQTTIAKEAPTQAGLAIQSVNPGVWTLTLTAHDATDKTLYSGTSTVEVLVGQAANAEIQMHAMQTTEGTGSFSVTFTFPDPLIPPANVVCTLFEYPDGVTDMIGSCTITPDTGTLVVSNNALKSGTYELSLSVTLNDQTLTLPGGGDHQDLRFFAFHDSGRSTR